MNWKEILAKNPIAAVKIQAHIERCICGQCDRVDVFDFEMRDGFVKAVGPNDVAENLPPIWYIPAEHASQDSDKLTGYCTSKPSSKEILLLQKVGFSANFDHLEGSPFGKILNSLIRKK